MSGSARLAYSFGSNESRCLWLCIILLGVIVAVKQPPLTEDDNNNTTNNDTVDEKAATALDFMTVVFLMVIITNGMVYESWVQILVNGNLTIDIAYYY